MAVQNSGNVFVVKDRLEALEKRIETALDEAGLKDFTKTVAREAMKDLLKDVMEELQNKKDGVLEQVKVERVEMDSRLKETQSTFDVAIAEHVSRIEESIAQIEVVNKSLDRLDKVVKLSLVASFVSMVLSLYL